jgi:cyclophilin family peptidyl-prolyl cis-trans isomerase
VLARIQENYSQDVRVIYRHFPLISIHDKAALATQAAEAAGAQGKFWEMHDLLFERQPDWSGMSVEDFKTWLLDRASELELETQRFETDLQSEANKALAQAAWDEGVKTGMPGTPFLLVNGEIFPSNVPMSAGNVSALIALELLEKQQFGECPPMSIDPQKQYLATLKTEKGDIVIELLPEESPLAVNNFVFLARNGWFDGVTFHRVLPGFVAQSGDPSGTGFGGPGYAFVNETSPDLKYDKAGMVGMANSGKDSNGSQFFITYAPTPQLDGGYTIFGQVVSGMDVATNLTPRDPSTSFDLPPGDKILSVTIEEK